VDSYGYSDALKKYYKVVASLPRMHVLLSALALISTVAILLKGLEGFIIVLHMLSVVLVVAVYSRVTRSVFKRFKRVLGLALFILTYTLLVSLIASAEVGILSAVAVLIIALQGLDGTRLYRYLVAITPLYATIAVLLLLQRLLPIPLQITTGKLAKYALFSLVAIAFDLAIYWYLSRFRVGSYGAADLGTFFFWNNLEKDKTLDAVFEKLSKSSVVKPIILKSDRVLLIYTDIHYGPFANLGSSLLPKILHEKFFPKGLIPVVLHGMGGHDRDLASSSILEPFANFLEKIADSVNEELLYHGCFSLKGDDYWEVKGLVFSKAVLIFVSRPIKGIDDLPYSLYVEFSELCRKRGFGDLILVDSHNWERSETFNIESLVKLLEQSLEVVEKLRERPAVRVALRAMCCECDAEGVIDGVVCALELRGVDGRDPFILVYFRGNNMAPNLRNKIIKTVKNKLGVSEVEVVTNDEHTETAIHPRVAYIPVQDSYKVHQCIDSLVRALDNQDYSVGLYMSRGEAEYPLLGENAYKLIDLLEKTFPKAAALISSYILTAPIIAAMLLI